MIAEGLDVGAPADEMGAPAEELQPATTRAMPMARPRRIRGR